MVHINFLVIALSALIPLIIGAIWYSKPVFGNLWIKVSGVSMEETKKAHMAVVFGLTYVFSFFIAFSLNFMVIHQFSMFSILANEPGLMDKGSEINNYVTDFMMKYGNNFRTFKHGALHGFMGGLFIAMPILAINSMFENKGFKYNAINAGYWIVSMTLMGGVICQFS
jgi:hypothetical protein